MEKLLDKIINNLKNNDKAVAETLDLSKELDEIIQDLEEQKLIEFITPDNVDDKQNIQDK